MVIGIYKSTDYLFLSRRLTENGRRSVADSIREITGEIYTWYSYLLLERPVRNKGTKLYNINSRENSIWSAVK